MANEGLTLKIPAALTRFRLTDEGLRNRSAIVLTDLNYIRESWGVGSKSTEDLVDVLGHLLCSR